MSKIEVNTIEPQSGTTVTLGASGHTLSVPSGATLDMSSGTMTLNSTMKNTPAFHAYLGTSYGVGNNVVTKLNCDTEVYDTDSCYDNSTNYRFTPTVAGKYFVYMNLCGETSAYKLYFMKAKIYKNGSELVSSENIIGDNAMQRAQESLSFIVDMNGSSDYVEAYGHVDIHANGAEKFIGGSAKSSYFGAYRIIGA